MHFKGRTALFLLAPAFLAAGAARASAQAMPPREGSAPGRERPRPVPGPTRLSPGEALFLGGVPDEGAPGTDLPLAMSEAIERGLRHNLGGILSDAARRAAAGERLRLRSDLLPDITTRTSTLSQQINLAAFGFSGFPGTPSVVGPFGVFDTRVFVTAPLVDLRALRNARMGAENLKAADFTYQDARDSIVLAVAGLYLQAAAWESRVEAIRAQLETAEALYQQAVDLKTSGLVPAIEVLRLQVERETQRQRHLAVRNESEKAKLALARAVGLPVAQKLHLTDPMAYRPVEVPPLEALLENALGARSDYQAALARVRAAEAGLAAARAERLPSLSVDANYGTIGRRPNDSHGTYNVTASLTVPIFSGGRVRGSILEGQALLEQRRSEAADLRNRIALEVRTAMLDLESARQQVATAAETVKLGTEQLRHARDRFAAGVSSNIEVVQAQEALAGANDTHISSLLAFSWAKGALARAAGGVEKTYRQYLLDGGR
jgi:outer membrane protein TolC